MNKRIIFSILITLVIIVLTFVGTFAYFSSSLSGKGNKIEGASFKFDVDFALTVNHQANSLVPLKNELVKNAISKSSNKCIDNSGNEVCSLFTLKLENSGSPLNLNGYVTTTSSSYTTNNLKYQIFNSSYNAISDVMTLAKNTNGKVYFSKNGSMLSTELNTNNITYYLAIWLTDTGTLQKDDYSKNFSGKAGFESTSGGRIDASFSA